MPIPPPATTCPLAPRRRPSAICHPPAAAVPATSWPICAFPGPIPGGKACPDSTTKCSHKDSHQLAHLRIRQCNSWCRDPPDRTTNDSHEGHQVVLETHRTNRPACHKTATRSARHTHRKKRDALTCPFRRLNASAWAGTKIFSHTHHHLEQWQVLLPIQ